MPSGQCGFIYGYHIQMAGKKNRLQMRIAPFPTIQKTEPVDDFLFKYRVRFWIGFFKPSVIVFEGCRIRFFHL